MSKRPLIIIILSIFAVLILGLNFVSRHYSTPILMYHSVKKQVPAGSKLVVSVKAFERQMRFLKSHHYNVVPLGIVAALIKEKKKIPARTVVITFDDGRKDNYTYAFPVLKKYHLPATIFVIINIIGGPQGDMLSWDEIKTMRDSGLIYFGSHTLDHKDLKNIKSEQEIKRQIFDSKKILEKKLGIPIDAFSYPTGGFTPQIKQFVKEAGYKLAVATNSGKNLPNNDIFALRRIKISSSANNSLIFWLQTSGYYNFFRENIKRANGEK
jgi:peptidoglycan/xylan/chitin deacetylase (PgdA/CDA1 family)